MALVIADRVKETTTTTGTGAVSLAGATTGFQSFSAGVGDGNTTYYAINLVGGSEWEVGIGEYTQSTDTLSRDTVLASSNGGALVNFSAGTKDVFVTYPADRAVYEDDTGNLTLLEYTETVYALSGTTPALDPANGTIQTWTLSANSTPTDSLSAGQSLVLMIDDGAAYTVTWPSVTWVNNAGVAPTLATSGYTVVVLWKVSTTLYGALAGDGT